VSRENLFAAFFFVVFVFLLYQLGLFLSPFFRPAAGAVILALTFYPLTDWLTACCAAGARWLRSSSSSR
jgi:predicted PurR-regulated permease PerM